MPRWSLGSVLYATPPSADAPPASLRKICALSPMMISSPRPAWVRIETRLPIVPLATKTAASLPNRSAAIASRRLSVGSSPKTSSPSSASAIARRISGEGWVTVSLRRSTSLNWGLLRRLVSCSVIRLVSQLLLNMQLFAMRNNSNLLSSDKLRTNGLRMSVALSEPLSF